MPDTSLKARYRQYLDCLNAQAWDRLGELVAQEVVYNDQCIGLAGYRAMLEHDYLTIPDLRFVSDLLLADPPWIACRLVFDCSPRGTFLGLETHGRRITFSEHVFYRFEQGKIVQVQSLIDEATVRRAIAQP